VSALPGRITPGVLTAGPYAVCITSFLAAFLRIIGMTYDRRAARALLQGAGKHVEIFLPFYKWFGSHGDVRALALQEFRALSRFYGMQDLRAVHAGYASQGFLLARFFMNPADPRTHRQTVARMSQELKLIGLLRRELGIEHPVLYVLHLGRREKGAGWREAFQASVSAVRAVLDDALAAGACIAVENMYSQHGTESIGTTLGDLSLFLAEVGREWVDRGVLGWTFDPSHALIAYSGNYDAIERDVRPLLPDCVHLHVNHPRTTRDRAGDVFSEWGRGDDYHAAPVRIPQRARYWSLLRTAVMESRVREWRTITYEVNWEVPILRLLFGGSPLRDVRIGFEALERFCNHPTEALDVPAIERYIDRRLAGNSSGT
jgi:sugar phosphate isomerase/epimerase